VEPSRCWGFILLERKSKINRTKGDRRSGEKKHRRREGNEKGADLNGGRADTSMEEKWGGLGSPPQGQKSGGKDKRSAKRKKRD